MDPLAIIITTTAAAGGDHAPTDDMQEEDLHRRLVPLLHRLQNQIHQLVLYQTLMI